ncbi:MAG: IgGFc-binding protein, partial [Tannerellaceae bacterium]|nr:IgGFc-binding protein [Tannerellaceae bacterium]
MKKYTLLFAFFLSLIYYSAFAQITTQGTDFYVSFGQNAGNAVSAVTMQIRIAATQDATVTFTFKADASTVTLNVQAGQVYTYNLDATQKTNVYSIAEGTSDKSLRIQSTAPVSVYALNQSSATTDATNVLPVNNLGMDYYQVSYQPLSTYADGYTVIATVNGTTVYENGSSKATLNAGQVYSAYYLSTDATGRHITSDHPIAYFATNSCVNVPVGTTYCDCLYQQMVPVNSWGNNFLVPVTHRGKERVRVVASQNNTTVAQTGGVKKTDGGGGAQNPANENSFTLNAGQFAEFEIALTTGGAYISADKPVAVASYLLGTGYSGLSDAIGDPALAWVPAVEQAADMAVIAPFAPSGGTNLAKHYALVVTPTATRDNTTIAIGSEAPAALSGGSWTTGNGSGSGMSFYSLQLTNTAASYYFNNLAGLTVMGYGTGSAESYYYLSGSAGRSLNPAFYINDVHYQDIDGNVFCGQTSFHIEGVAQFQVSSAPGHLK